MLSGGRGRIATASAPGWSADEQLEHSWLLPCGWGWPDNVPVADRFPAVRSRAKVQTPYATLAGQTGKHPSAGVGGNPVVKVGAVPVCRLNWMRSAMPRRTPSAPARRRTADQEVDRAGTEGIARPRDRR
jgi:hypothetical protein